MQDDERKGLPSAHEWGRLKLCAGSKQLVAQAIRANQAVKHGSADAKHGNRVHAYLGGVPDEDGKEIQLNPEEQNVADTLQDLAASQAGRIFGDKKYFTLKEKRLWLYDRGKPVLSGRFDRCCYTSEIVLCQDFKTGHLPPEPAETNPQLEVLAVLCAIAFPEAAEIVTQIISPYFDPTEARYGLRKLAEAYNDIFQTLKAINDEHAPLVPGIVQCRYCPAILICQAVKDTIGPITKLRISELPVEGDRAARLLDEVTLLEKHLKEIKMFYVEQFSKDPERKIPGWALAPGNSVREITDWPKAREILRRYIPDRELEGVPPLSQLKQALKKALKLPTPKAADEKLNMLLGDLLTFKQNAPSLRRVSGKPAITELPSESLTA